MTSGLTFAVLVGILSVEFRLWSSLVSAVLFKNLIHYDNMTNECW